jgi:hypothetical protein
MSILMRINLRVNSGKGIIGMQASAKPTRFLVESQKDGAQWVCQTKLNGEIATAGYRGLALIKLFHPLNVLGNWEIREGAFLESN